MAQVNGISHILRYMNGSKVEEKRTRDGQLTKLFIERDNVGIKIEPNMVLRGSIYPVIYRNLDEKAQQLLEMSLTDVCLLSVADLYAGKICAALDRQHPRDLFDIKVLYETFGITNEIRQAFVGYLAGNNSPIHELLAPNSIDLSRVFREEFLGMTNLKVGYDELLKVRKKLINDICENLTDDERKFLLSIKLGEPDWGLMDGLPLKDLPSIQWKLINIKKMSKKKHQILVDKLKKTLGL